MRIAVPSHFPYTLTLSYHNFSQTTTCFFATATIFFFFYSSPSTTLLRQRIYNELLGSEFLHRDTTLANIRQSTDFSAHAKLVHSINVHTEAHTHTNMRTTSTMAKVRQQKQNRKTSHASFRSDCNTFLRCVLCVAYAVPMRSIDSRKCTRTPTDFSSPHW